MGFRIWIVGLIACAVLVILSIMYVDRPLAEFLERHVRHTELWIVLDRALKPLSLVAVFALLFVFYAGSCVLFRGGLPAWTTNPLICSRAVLWGLATEFVLKQVFGRSWPEPTYIRYHLYGFRFLHAGDGWGSFPSGTAIGSMALGSVIWILFPRWRGVGAALPILISAAVVITNYHWLSDVIAGAFLGISIGCMSVAYHVRVFRDKL